MCRHGQSGRKGGLWGAGLPPWLSGGLPVAAPGEEGLRAPAGGAPVPGTRSHVKQRDLPPSSRAGHVRPHTWAPGSVQSVLVC